MKRCFFNIPGVAIIITLSIFVFAHPGFGIEILVDAGDPLLEASPLVFGNSVIHNGDTMGYSKWVSDQRTYDEAKRAWNHYLPYISELAPTILRYPGGLAANNFLWKSGIGPISERDPNFSEPGVPQTFGTDEFLLYCEEVGAEAIFVVNVSTTGGNQGTVQDAADWVEYCNAPNNGSNPGGGTDWASVRAANGHHEPYGVRFWELGNEETYPGWASYAQRVQNYSAAMKAIDPTIQVGVFRTGEGLDTLYQRETWLSYHTFMLEHAGDSFDFWIHHAHGPAATGSVKGFAMCSSGASMDVDFTVEQGGDYRFSCLVEGKCKDFLCPGLVLEVDGTERGDWRIIGPVSEVESSTFTLQPGVHGLKLLAYDVGSGERVVVRMQVSLTRVGEEESVLVDLRDSLEWYHALLGYGPMSRETYEAAEPYLGGKPVYYTEVNTVYTDVVSTPYYSKSSALREMLNTGCVYHVLLNKGVPLANYWILFQDRSGIGTLEGVALDGEADELGRVIPHRRPVFHLLKTYGSNVLDRIISSEVTGAPEFLVGPQTGIYIGYAQKDFSVPYVQSLATVSDDGSRMSLFVINLDPEQGHEIPVTLEGFQHKANVDVFTITGSTPGSNNEPEDCPAGECVTRTDGLFWISGDSFLYTFPKHSVTTFVFHGTGTNQVAPATPTDLRGAAGDGAVLLAWDAVFAWDLEGYNIYVSRRPEGPFQHRVNTVPVTVTEYLHESVDNGVQYTYAVRAVDQHGNESPLSDKVRLTPFPGGGTPQGPLPGGGEDETPPSPPFLIEAK